MVVSCFSRMGKRERSCDDLDAFFFGHVCSVSFLHMYFMVVGVGLSYAKQCNFLFLFSD